MHCYALLRSLVFAKTYVKLTRFFTAENITLDTKIIANSESSSKMNMASGWTIFKILPASAVVCIQRVSYENGNAVKNATFYFSVFDFDDSLTTFAKNLMKFYRERLF